MGMQKAITAAVGGFLAILAQYIEIPASVEGMVNAAIPMLTVAAVWFVPNKSA